MTVRTLFVASLVCFTLNLTAQDIMVDGETIGRFISREEFKEMKKGLFTLENGNHWRLHEFGCFRKDKRYIELLSNKIKATIDKVEYDHLLFSYHGIPVSHLKISDPTNSHCYKVNNCCSTQSDAHKFCYKHQVLETTEAVIKKLKIDKNKYSNAFQSRLPNEAWLKPYTDDELVRLAKEGKKRMVIVTPAFVTDCLETLEEIEMEGKEEFLEAGGESYHYVPCLNDDNDWAELISKWAN